MTFLPELVSMNGVMAGMAALSVPWLQHLMGPGPGQPSFWFVLSLSLTLGFVVAYPLNWWLVAAGLKHGMLTVQPAGAPVPLAAGLALAGAAIHASGAHPAASHPGGHDPTAEAHNPKAREGDQQTGRDNHGADAGTRRPDSRLDTVSMTSISFVILTAGVIVAGTLGSLTAH